MTKKGVRPRDENDGVVDMALAFVVERQNSHPLLLLDDIPPHELSSRGLRGTLYFQLGIQGILYRANEL
jgi:hypothetical protein